MSEETLLSLLVVNIDYKLQQWRQPYPALSATVVNHRERKPVYVPVIRIFGSTDSGQRCCAHIHGVLPYVYFRPENLQHATFDTETKARSLMSGLEAALEDLLYNYKSTTWKTAAPRQNRSQYSKRKRIHSLETVRKKTLYGMHMESFMFIKVVLYDPNDVKRVAAILEEGAIRGISMQSYESHIPYLLQFTSDFNIQPMGWMHLSTAKFRLPLPPDPASTIQHATQPAASVTINTTITPSGTQDSASVDPTNGLFNSPIKGVHTTAAISGAIGGIDTIDSPLFSSVHNSGNYTGTLHQPAREESTISNNTDSSVKVNRTAKTAVEPHVYLTQHQLSHYVCTSEEMNSSGGGSIDPIHSSSTNSNKALTQGAKKAKLFTQSSIPHHLVWNEESDKIDSTNIDMAEKADSIADASSSINTTTIIDTTTSAVNTNLTLSAEEQAEIEMLLQGITAEDMKWSQHNTVVAANNANGSIVDSAAGNIASSTVPISITHTNTTTTPINTTNSTNLISKESTCELEIDIHHSYILNTIHPRVAFGAELWAEEHARCVEKGLSMDTITTPLSTQTVYREPQPTEMQYRQRWENLKLKGLALRAASRHKLSSYGVGGKSGANTSGGGSGAGVESEVMLEPSSRRSTVPYDVCGTANVNTSNDGIVEDDESVDIVDVPLLTQAAATVTDTPQTDASTPLPNQPTTQPSLQTSSLPLPISQWAFERIHEATQQAHIDLSTQQHYLNPDNIAEDYFKSQISIPESGDVGDNNNLTARGVQLNHEEEEDNEEAVSQEMCDILMSTQVNLDNMHELNNNNMATSSRNCQPSSTSSSYKSKDTIDTTPAIPESNRYDYSPILTHSPIVSTTLSHRETSPESENSIFSESFIQHVATTTATTNGDNNTTKSKIVRTESVQRPPLHPSRTVSTSGGNKSHTSTPNLVGNSNHGSISRSNSIDYESHSSVLHTDSADKRNPLTQHSPASLNSGDRRPSITNYNGNNSIHSPVSHLLQQNDASGSESPLLVPYSNLTFYAISSKTTTTTTSAAMSSNKRTKFVDPYATTLSTTDSPIFPGQASVHSSSANNNINSRSSSSGTKSICSVFRKRKHSAVSFALFPEPVAASAIDSPIETAVTIAAATPTSSVKKAKRSVSFREAEEICFPAVNSDSSRRSTQKSALSVPDYVIPVRTPLSFPSATTAVSTVSVPPISTSSIASITGVSSSSDKHTLRSIRSVYSNTPPLDATKAAPLLPSAYDINYSASGTTSLYMTDNDTYSRMEELDATGNNTTSQSPELTPIPRTAATRTKESPAIAKNNNVDAILPAEKQALTSSEFILPIQAPSIPPVSPVALLQPPYTTRIALYPTFTAPIASSLAPIETFHLPTTISHSAHYSKKKDALLTTIVGTTSYLTDLRKLKYLHDLPAFYSVATTNATFINPLKLENRMRCLIPTFTPPPPILFKHTTKNESVTNEKRLKQRYESMRVDDTSQIATPTQTPYTCAEPVPLRKSTDTNVNTTTTARKHRLTTLSMEIYCNTRQDFLPNPKYDAVQCIIYVVDDCIGNSDSESVKRVSGVICVLQEEKKKGGVSERDKDLPSNTTKTSSATTTNTSNVNAGTINGNNADGTVTGTNTNNAMVNATLNTTHNSTDTILLAQQRALLASCNLPTSTFIEVVSSEHLLFTKLISIVRTIDPDFIVGYNIENKSIGYLIKRAYVYEINLVMELSRVPEERGSYKNGPMPVFKNNNTAATTNPDTTKHNNNQHNTNNDQTEDEGPIYEATDNVDKSEISSEIVLTGRIVLNVWRLMREEVKLFNYTYSNVAAHVMNVRVPYFTHAQLTRWFRSPLTRYKTIRYVHLLSTLNLQLLESVDHIRKTSECARLYHIDYNSVITRGSQYRVEASLLYKAHINDFLLISPSRRAVASQAPMEVIPLVLEPESTLYTDPVVVLDFQSLYPSMMLAYNLCYSTIMGKMRGGEGGDTSNNTSSSSSSSSGRSTINTNDSKDDSNADTAKEPIQSTVANITVSNNSSTYAYKEADTTERLGAIAYPESISALNATLHHIHNNTTTSNPTNSTNNHTSSIDDHTHTPYIAPNGSVFCHKNTRLGILPQMVQEMLTTRVMVKRAMKRHARPSGTTGAGSRDVLQKVMDARQLAIKLLSNVTYGYTSAGFTGRMPMAELADAIVQSGRSTLEWTIKEIQSHPEWKAKVVYGDTDSVFVLLKGRSREQAFRIGQEISDFITSRSPAEVILKFEKVYLPCILVTKKRYVGNMYETITQVIPHFEAKGIEVVRRDQCVAVVKMQEKALRLLFETLDMSRVKSYIVGEWSKMMQGGDKLLLRDFIFSKEVRYGQYASVSSQPPGAVVACKAVLHDEMCVPPYNWRVPYVVVCGVPNAQLRSLVCSPEEVLRRGSELRLNYVYYMTKCINPALDRVLSLCGGEVFSWFKSISRPKLRLRHINYDHYSDSRDNTAGSSSSTSSASGTLALHPNNSNNKKRHKQTSMDQYTTQGTCEICSNDALPMKTLCHVCTTTPLTTLTTLFNKLHVYNRKEQTLAKICHNCAKYAQPSVLYMKNEVIGPDTCESLDCQVMYERARLVTKIEDCQVSLSEIEEL